MSAMSTNAFLGLLLYFLLSSNEIHTMDQAPQVLRKITCQNGLVALDQVHELHLNIEKRKSKLPSTLIADLQEAVGSRSITQVESIVRNLNVCPFPFSSDVVVSEATSKIALEKLVTVILALKENNFALAYEVFNKILAQCPELIPDHRLFATVIPDAIETNSLEIFIPQFPLIWFTRFCRETQGTKSSHSNMQKICDSATIARITEILAVLPLTLRTRINIDTQATLKDTLRRKFNRLLIARHQSI